MSRNNRITNAKAQKLRAGHTYWRCQIQRDGMVCISEEFLSGSKFTKVSRSLSSLDAPVNKRKVLSTSLYVGNKREAFSGNYLSSVNPGSSINTFTTRRAAQRWKWEVEAGWHPEAVAAAMEHWDFCDSMNRMFDDYGYDDYYEANDDRFALEA